MAAPRKTTEQTDDIDLSLEGDESTDTALGSTGEGEALPAAPNPFDAVPEGEVEVARKAEEGEPSDPSGEKVTRRKAAVKPATKKDPLAEIDTFDKLPVAVSVGEIVLSVEEVRGNAILAISLRGWVGDPPLKIRASDVGELENALKELRKELSA